MKFVFKIPSVVFTHIAQNETCKKGLYRRQCDEAANHQRRNLEYKMGFQKPNEHRNEKSDSQQWSYDDIILVPQSLQRTLTGSRRVNQFIVKAASSETTKSAIQKIETFLKGKISDEWSYNVYSANEWIEQDTQMTTMLTLVVGGIAGISLLVGGIGIMNIMLVSVSERTREIGIRRAIGAQRSSIVTQFLIEAAMLCGIGGVIGILLGTGGCLLLGGLLFKMTIYPSVTVTAGAFGLSVMLGIIFGCYPAVKASNLQPVEALRAE